MFEKVGSLEVDFEKEEGRISFDAKFKQQDDILKLDILQDWLGFLESIYNDIEREIDRIKELAK